MDVIDKSRESTGADGLVDHSVRSVGNAVIVADEALLTFATSRVYRFRARHPWLYGMIAFVLGGGLVAIFTMSTYKNWAYESIDLTIVLRQVILGGLGGGIVAIVLAFAYANTVRDTMPAMRSRAELKR